MRTGPKLKRATLRQAVMVPLRVTLTHFYHSYNSVFNGGTGEARTLDLRNAIAALLPTELQSHKEHRDDVSRRRSNK